MYITKVIEAFLIIKWEEFPVLIDLIGLITSTDFNQFQNLSQFPALEVIDQFITAQFCRCCN